MEKTIKLTEIIEAFLGRPGRLVSMSKSCGPSMAVYNSNLVVGDEVIWYGDIDLDESRATLCAIAALYDITIKIYREHDLRVFPFEVTSAAEMKAEWIKKMEKCKPVFTTDAVHLYDGKDYDEVREENEKWKAERIKDRMIGCGALTPRGTDWKWYNTWFYNGPHKIYRIVRFLVRTHIGYPLKCASYEDKGKIKKFFKVFIKEFGYLKIGLESGETTLKDYFWNH